MAEATVMERNHEPTRRNKLPHLLLMAAADDAKDGKEAISDEKEGDAEPIYTLRKWDAVATWNWGERLAREE